MDLHKDAECNQSASDNFISAAENSALKSNDMPTAKITTQQIDYISKLEELNEQKKKKLEMLKEKLSKMKKRSRKNKK